VKPKTEELLYLLLWSCDQMFNPTFRNLTDSFEAWAYRNGLLRQLHALEQQRFLERSVSRPDPRLLRLTEKGRLHALGGRDPEAEWARPWDGQWRLVVYDVPVQQNSRRWKLSRYLRSQHFGCLQNSVWVSPDPLTEQRKILAGAVADVESLILLEARPSAGESDEEIVLGAWDFDAINRCYLAHMSILDSRPSGALRGKNSRAFHRWASDEREAWQSAVTVDPLLPRPLLPKGYAGRKAWKQRIATLARARKQLETFLP
jgi:phenylacetic acid degradation operon negative regulatory protein